MPCSNPTILFLNRTRASSLYQGLLIAYRRPDMKKRTIILYHHLTLLYLNRDRFSKSSISLPPKSKSGKLTSYLFNGIFGYIFNSTKKKQKKNEVDNKISTTKTELENKKLQSRILNTKLKQAVRRQVGSSNYAKLKLDFDKSLASLELDSQRSKKVPEFTRNKRVTR